MMPQALAPSSNSTAFDPGLGDFVIEAYSRIQVRPSALAADHRVQARMSANLVFVEFSNIGMPLLWKCEEIIIPLVPGQRSYTLPKSDIALLDAFVRTYQPGTPTILRH